LIRILETCDLTVARERWVAVAISWFDLPTASPARISRSRRLRSSIAAMLPLPAPPITLAEKQAARAAQAVLEFAGPRA